MAHSLEVRVPILDHELVQWVSSLPSQLKLKGGNGKYIFKRALSRHLSSEILFRKKMGFDIPLASWFRGPLRARIRSALLGPVLESSGYFNMTRLGELLTQHESGMRDNSTFLWPLLMFESFLKRHRG